MADNSTTATFVLALEDETSGSAESAAKALEQLHASINKDQKALANLQRAQKSLQGGTSVNVATYRNLEAQIKATKERISQTQGAIVDLGGALGSSKPRASKFTEALRALGEKTEGIGGPIEGLGAKLKGLTGKGLVVLGVAAIGAAMVALAVSVGVATAALLKFGIASANARRAELLQLEGLTKMRSMWGLAAGNAGEIQAAIDNVSGSTALGRAETAKYATSLYKMGLRGENLSQALEGVAIKATTQGDEAAQAFAGLASGIALSVSGSQRRVAPR